MLLLKLEFGNCPILTQSTTGTLITFSMQDLRVVSPAKSVFASNTAAPSNLGKEEGATLVD